MTEIDEISARLTVIETVVRQLITHMAIRDDNPSRWIQTRKTLALRALEVDGPQALARAILMRDATADFFDQAEMVAADYTAEGKPGTPGALLR